MSRSYRKNPFMGMCATSDKAFKVKSHRAFRLRARMALALAVGTDLESLVLPLEREVANVYSGPKDGKCLLIFSDPDDFARFMRK